MAIKLIADSGSSKTDWCLIYDKKKINIQTQGISPYFLNAAEIEQVLRKELVVKMKKYEPDEVFYYGTGCSNPENVKLVKSVIKKVFPKAKITVDHDLLGAAKALCGNEKGIACILGTGSNSCFYNGKKVVKNSPGLGYVLGDEGSGAYLGKKVLQYFLYQTFDEELMLSFQKKYNLNKSDILNKIYREPLPNRYLASFATFLSEHRGHYMIENIIEDGINDFFYTHLNKLNESWLHPIHFAGTIAYVFRDVIKQLAAANELEIGSIVKSPMEGLIAFHKKEK